MTLIFNVLAIMLCLYFYQFQQTVAAAYPLPLLLLSIAALIMKTGRVLPLLMVMLNICLLCMGAVVFVVVIVDGPAIGGVASPALVLALIAFLLVTAAFNVLKLRGRAGVNKAVS